jgi:hypothetical protein
LIIALKKCLVNTFFKKSHIFIKICIIYARQLLDADKAQIDVVWTQIENNLAALL